MFNKRLVKLIEGSMRYVIRNVLAQWLGLCCHAATMGAIAWLAGNVLDKKAGVQQFLITGGIALLCTVLRYVFTTLASRFSFQSSANVKLALRQSIYTKLLELGPSYHLHVGTSEVVQMAVEGVEQLEVYFGKYLPQLFYSLLAPLTLFVVLAFVSLPPAAVLLACVPLIPGSIMMVQKFAKKLLAKYWGKYTAMGDSFLENLQGLTTLKIYDADEAYNERMNIQAEDFRRVTMKVLTMQLNSVTLMDLVAYGGAAIGIITAIRQVIAGSLGFPGCLFIMLLASDFFMPLRLLGSYFHTAMNGNAASEKIFRLLDTPAPAKGRQERLDINMGIWLNDVSFSYDGKRTVLSNINMQAQRGITAIVGESGCGKSTIASLLTGGINGHSGRVTIGGVDVGDIAPATLARAITLVPHNGYLFKGTVRENLRMARHNATDEEMWAALSRVNISSFLQQENGLDTSLTEQAANLSGGQRQRLVLARALLHDTPIYIFDEATSNIDVESENDIAAAIWAMAAEKTVLMITHRLANAIPAGVIYVMQQGRVVESGGHQQLLMQNGLYASMYTAQQGLEHPAMREAAHG